MTELKPCPFCGGKNLTYDMSDIDGWIAHVACKDCDDMLGPMSKFKYDDESEAQEDAANIWNTRADRSLARIAELEAEVARLTVDRDKGVWDYCALMEKYDAACVALKA